MKPAPKPAEQKPAQEKKPAQLAAKVEEKKAEDGDAGGAYKIITSKLDFDDSMIKEDRPGGSATAQQLPQEDQKKDEKPKDVEVRKMQSTKSDETPTYKIETTTMDMDEDSPQPASSRAQTTHSSLPRKSEKPSSGQQANPTNGDAKKHEDEPLAFKIETTVATPEMIKHLVGDNTPDEEEAAAQAPRAVAKPQPL